MRSLIGAHRRRLVVAAALATMLVGVGQTPALASHDSVTAVRGGAYGYYLSIGLFGGPPNLRGPSPAVTLASERLQQPQTATHRQQPQRSVPPPSSAQAGWT